MAVKKSIEKIEENGAVKRKEMVLSGSLAYKVGMKFGEKVQILMDSHGHSQKALAALIGTQQSSISNVLLNKQFLRPAQLLALSKVYGVSIDSLIDETRPLEILSNADRLVTETVKKIGAEEALNRLWLTRLEIRSDIDRDQRARDDPADARFNWGHLEVDLPDDKGGKPARSKPKQKADG